MYGIVCMIWYRMYGMVCYVLGPVGGILKKHKFHGLVGPPAGIFENKHKFHGLVGPPAAIFEKNNNLQNQEEKF